MYTLRYRRKGSNEWEEVEVHGDFTLWRTEDGFSGESWCPRKKGDELKINKDPEPFHVISDPYGIVAVTSSGEPEVPDPD